MNVRSQLLPLDQKVLEIAERKFSEISQERCEELHDGKCDLTGKACTLYDCPKMVE